MKRKIFRIALIIFLILALSATAHYFIFPEETRCMLIRFAAFDKKENIYSRKSADAADINELLRLRSIAEKRNDSFWGSSCKFDYNFIYCNIEKDFNNYGGKAAPAVTQLKLGAYIVLQKQSLDADIIAHEISHTVMYNNIGWYKTMFKIPTWFNEGLAMQVDNRDYYSIDTLMAKKRSGIPLPAIMNMKTPGEFFSGTTEAVMLNYATAKYVVHEWLKTHPLQNFIEAVRNGVSFENAYGTFEKN